MEAVDLFLAHPVALFVVLLVGAMIGISFEKTFARIDRDRRKAYWAGRNAGMNGRGKVVPLKGRSEYAKAADVALARGGKPDASDQLRCVMAAKFTSRSLLNRPEAALFKALDAEVISRNPAWQVMAQVSLGEFLASEDSDAYFAINSKRVDFALMDDRCRVRHAIEYHGTGHHMEGGGAAARDAVKQEALRKADIGYEPIIAGKTNRADLKRLIERLVPPE